MPVSTTAPASTYHPGLVATSTNGLGLKDDAAAKLEQEIQQTQQLIDAMVQGIGRARAAGLQGFAPDDSQWLDLPVGLAQSSQTHNQVVMSNLDHLFAKVLRRRFQDLPEFDPRAALYAGLPAYGTLSLAEWSTAAQQLEQFMAQARSKLAPGQGGGIQYADGVWYVNGERYSMAELFVAMRVGNFFALDDQIGRQINTVNTNTLFARDVLSSLAEMQRIRGNKARLTTTSNPTGSEKKAVYDATTDFKNVIETARDGRTRTMAEYEKLAANLTVSTSYIKLAADAQRTGTQITAVDYASLINEMRTLFDTLNADNQVQQLRSEALNNVRNNILDSLSAFLKSNRDELSSIRRNLR